MSKLNTKLVLLALILLSAVMMNSRLVKAATTFNITPTSDCTLPDAIVAANTDTASGSCDAGSGADTINLAAGTYTLAADLPAVTNSVTINGAGIDQSIVSGNDGSNLHQLFIFASGSSASNAIRDLTLTEYNNAAISALDTNISIENIEVDGGIDFSAGYGIMLENESPDSVTFNMNNVYVHNFHYTGVNSGSGITPIGISGGDAAGIGVINYIANNVTVSDISTDNGYLNNFIIAIGAYSGFKSHTINAQLSNITIDNIVNTGPAGSASLLGATNTIASGTSTLNLDVDNVTMRGLRGFTGSYGPSFAFGAAGAGIGTGSSAVINSNLTNIMLSDNLRDTTSANCVFADYTSLFGGVGSTEVNVNSSGGNISDDTSCSSYFTDPTDQNNVDPADLMLGTLSDNGGSVPTIPLLPGSIAIDSGVTVPGLITDARGVTRPQCSAYDSGAYEYNGICPVEGPEPTSNTLTYPDPITSSTVTLELPNDVTNASVSAISPTTIPKDTFFSFPLGLTSFQFDTTIGATKTITLYYDLPGDPGFYTPRKYNTNTKTFATITNATITRTTYNNKSMLRLTYDITDGGTLDQDNQANGTIVDPVGLAQASVGVPNTGL